MNRPALLIHVPRVVRDAIESTSRAGAHGRRASTLATLALVASVAACSRTAPLPTGDLRAATRCDGRATHGIEQVIATGRPIASLAVAGGGGRARIVATVSAGLVGAAVDGASFRPAAVVDSSEPGRDVVLAATPSGYLSTWTRRTGPSGSLGVLALDRGGAPVGNVRWEGIEGLRDRTALAASDTRSATASRTASGIEVTVRDPSGASVAGPTTLADTAAASDLALTSMGHDFVLASVSAVDGNPALDLTRVDGSTAALTPLARASIAPGAHVAITSNGERLVVAWVAGRDVGTLSFDQRGLRTTPGQTLEHDAADAPPALAPTPDGIALTWADRRGGERYARLDGEGAPLGPILTVSNAVKPATSGVGPSIAWDGAEVVIADGRVDGTVAVHRFPPRGCTESPSPANRHAP